MVYRRQSRWWFLGEEVMNDRRGTVIELRMYRNWVWRNWEWGSAIFPRWMYCDIVGPFCLPALITYVNDFLSLPIQWFYLIRFAKAYLVCLCLCGYKVWNVGQGCQWRGVGVQFPASFSSYGEAYGSQIFCVPNIFLMATSGNLPYGRRVRQIDNLSLA